MIAILADDFSGAAELAGIAAVRGWSAEVQTRFDPASDAEVIALDTDTRLRQEAEAARIADEAARAIAAAEPEWIYKKTDSVLRGHVRAEIEAVLAATGRKDCLLVPANPSKGRIIENGRYFLDGVPLEKSVFADDPDFPARSSDVRVLLGESPHIRMPDIRTFADLPSELSSQTLPAGAADFFTRLLGDRPCLTTRETPPRTLLVCGSLAAWDSDRADGMRARGFLVRTMDDLSDGDPWGGTDRLLLAIGRPEKAEPRELTARLVEIAARLAGDDHDLRIALEGGATAIAFLRRMGWNRFRVVPENHVGVGSLRPPGGPLLSVKPGSYPWPETLFPLVD